MRTIFPAHRDAASAAKLAWSPASTPGAGTREQHERKSPWVRLAAQDSEEVLRQTESLLAAVSAQRGDSHESARN
jgi:hypothetical protein